MIDTNERKRNCTAAAKPTAAQLRKTTKLRHRGKTQTKDEEAETADGDNSKG
jgi:hypothetical protein